MTSNNLYHHPTTLKQAASAVISLGWMYRDAVGELIRALAIIGLHERVFKDEPDDLGDASFNAHLAGLAELMALHVSTNAPEWCMQRKYFLREPVFLSGSSVRYVTVDRTQSAFSKRLLFCEAISFEGIAVV